MKNKLAIIAATLLLLSGCAKNKIDDPLIIPPNFNEMPDLENPQQISPKSSEKDVEELKNLLLKNNN
ncbi:MAG: hypothetical protein V4612_02155 [Pseudomonadota bacterium]